jgi:hypothetical protein
LDPQQKGVKVLEPTDIKTLSVDERAEVGPQEVLQIARVSVYHCPTQPEDGPSLSAQDEEFLMSWSVA